MNAVGNGPGTEPIEEIRQDGIEVADTVALAERSAETEVEEGGFRAGVAAMLNFIRGAARGLNQHDETVGEVDMGRRQFLARSAATVALAAVPGAAFASAAEGADAHGELERALLRYPSHTLELINSLLSSATFARAIGKYFEHNHFDHKDWMMAGTHYAMHLAFSPHSVDDNLKHLGIDLGLLVPVLFGTAWGDNLPKIQELMGEESAFEITDEMSTADATIALIDEACRTAKVGALSSGAFAIHLGGAFTDLSYNKFFGPAFDRLESAKERLVATAQDNHAQKIEAQVAKILLGNVKRKCQESFDEREINASLEEAEAAVGEMRHYFSNGSVEGPGGEEVEITDEDRAAYAEFETAFAEFKAAIAYDTNAQPGTPEYDTLQKWESLMFFIQALRSWANNIGKLVIGDPPNFILMYQVLRRLLDPEKNGKLLTVPEGLTIQLKAVTGVMPNLLYDFEKSVRQVSAAFGEDAPEVSFADRGKVVGRGLGLTTLSAMSLIAEVPMRGVKEVGGEVVQDALDKAAESLHGMPLDPGEVAFMKKMKIHLGTTMGSIKEAASLVADEVVPLDVKRRREHTKMSQFLHRDGLNPDKLREKRDKEFDEARTGVESVEEPMRHQKRLFMRAAIAASPAALGELLGKLSFDPADFEELQNELEAVQKIRLSDHDEDHDTAHHQSRETALRWDRVMNVFGDFESARDFLLKTDLIMAVNAVPRPQSADGMERNLYAGRVAAVINGIMVKYSLQEGMENKNILGYFEHISHEILPIIKEAVGPGTEEVFALVAIQLVFLQSVMPTIKAMIDKIIGDKAVRDSHGKFEKVDEPIDMETFNMIISALVGLCSASAFADNMAMYMATSMKLLEELLDAGLITHDMFVMGAQALYNAAIEFGATTAAGGPASAPWPDSKINAPRKGIATVLSNALGNIPQFTGGNFFKRVGTIAAFRVAFEAIGAVASIRAKKQDRPDLEEGFDELRDEMFGGTLGAEEDKELQEAQSAADNVKALGGKGLKTFMSVATLHAKPFDGAVDGLFKQPGNRARDRRFDEFVDALSLKLGVVADAA